MTTASAAISMAEPRRIEVRYDGRIVPALSFPFVYPRGTRVARIVFAVFLAAVLVGAVITFFVSFSRVDSPLLIGARLAMLIVVAVDLPYLILHVRSSVGQAFVALLADGIYTRTGASRIFVAWDSITAIGPYEFAGCRYLGVRTSRPARAEPRWLRFLWQVNRKTAGWDMTYPLFVMPGGPAFAHLVQRCIDDPESRATVANAIAQ